MADAKTTRSDKGPIGGHLFMLTLRTLGFPQVTWGRFLEIRFAVRLTFSLQKAAKEFGEWRTATFDRAISMTFA